MYDLSQLEELAGGDQSFMRSMVDTFLEHTPGQLEEIKNARKNGDLASIGALSHKIKPNIDLFGIVDLKQTIRDLEQMGKAGEDRPEIDEKLKELDQILQQAFDQLRNF